MSPSTRRAPSELAIRWRSGPGRPLVIAHRGANREAPENTLLAFQRAKELGADGIELDVLLDADDRAVVCHDATMSRLTHGRHTASLRRLGTSDLSQIDLGQGQTVPSLASVLEWASGADVLVNVELKDDQGDFSLLARRVAECIANVRGASEWVLVSSFNPTLLAYFRKLAPEIGCAELIAPQRSWAARALALATQSLRWPPVSAVHPASELVHVESVAKWKRRGLHIHPWTVNDPNLARQFAALGIDALITDDPAGILTALAH